ncbi:MAG: NAD(P)/FAD-dependent oxidoreductase [bacterium]
MSVSVAVVGGGASGMMAAIAAAESGAVVTLFEKNQRVGKKLLATGNGRCNLTNLNVGPENYHGGTPEFALSVLAGFGVQSTLDFFDLLGVAPKVEEGGKVFPLSEQAGSVLDVLRWRLEALGVKILCESPVAGIKRGRSGFLLSLKNGKTFEAERLVLAAGGRAAPHLGSDGSGHALARLLGHTLVPSFPALVPLKLKADFLKQIQGVKFRGEAIIVVGGREVKKASGELLFTEYGISGPPILTLSRKAGEHLLEGQKVTLRLDIFPSISFGEMEECLAKRLDLGRTKSFIFSFVGFLNKKLIPVVLRESGVSDIHKAAESVTPSEVRAVVKNLKEWTFEVTGSTSWPHAQVTAGGLDVREINPATMESRILPGLFLAGEIVDIDGDCGGYNLQWAWSSGHVAGSSAGGCK